MPQGYVTSEYVFKGTLLELKIVVLVALQHLQVNNSYHYYMNYLPVNVKNVSHFWNIIMFHTSRKLQQAFSQRIDICLSVGNTGRQFCALYFTRKLRHWFWWYIFSELYPYIGITKKHVHLWVSVTVIAINCLDWF